MAKVQWRGVTLDQRTASMMEEVAKNTPVDLWVQPTQGSYSGAVGASAGTHNGGGAIDVAAKNLTSSQRKVLVREMRRVGFAAWLRTPSQSNWPYHVHGIAVQKGGKGDKGVLSSSAYSQVKAYYENRNGLANNGRDDGPRDFVGVTWEIYKRQESDVAFWMKYSGKPSGNLRLKADGRYVTVDATVPPPPRGGTREDRMVYLNLVPTWKLPKSDPLYYFQTASVRVRWSRAGDPPDRTAYQDFTITPWRSSFLLTHTHWERGEKGRGGKWSVSVVGHAASVYASTRYTKSAVE